MEFVNIREQEMWLQGKDKEQKKIYYDWKSLKKSQVIPEYQKKELAKIKERKIHRRWKDKKKKILYNWGQVSWRK